MSIKNVSGLIVFYRMLSIFEASIRYKNLETTFTACLTPPLLVTVWSVLDLSSTCALTNILTFFD